MTSKVLKPTEKPAKKRLLPPNAGKGRKKGVPNKATATAREAIAMVADGMAQEFAEWVRDIANGTPDKTDEEGQVKSWHQKPDPRGAAEVYLKAIEYHIPKLSRTEHAGHDGKALIPATINITGVKAPKRE